ncbi:MAG TPA: hypothetical protein VMT63_04710 [Bacteroidales bacterium]|nr:hypothetical protein [Bacteroidales bacterium]
METRIIGLKRLFLSFVLLIAAAKGFSQTTPAELSVISLKDQVQYIDDHTKVYDGWRAIREDIYRKVIGNFTDTLVAEKVKISLLTSHSARQRQVADSLNSALGSTGKELEEVTHARNTLSFFGIGINKTLYNLILWSVIAGLAVLLVLGFLVFRRNLSAYISVKKELKDMQSEFEEYRQTARKAREKMSMDHFNEIRRLKGQQGAG